MPALRLSHSRTRYHPTTPSTSLAAEDLPPSHKNSAEPLTQRGIDMHACRLGPGRGICPPELGILRIRGTGAELTRRRQSRGVALSGRGQRTRGRDRCALADVGGGGVPVSHPRARPALPVAAWRAGLEGAAGGAAV